MQVATKAVITTEKNVKICGVYVFRHASGKCYVGSSKDCKSRRVGHLRTIARGEGHFFHRQAAILGIENFTFEIIETCAPENLLDREAFHILRENSAENGFNVQKDPRKIWSVKWNDEMRERQSNMMKQRFSDGDFRTAHASSIQRYYDQNPESKIRISNRLSTPEAKAFHSKRMKNYWASPEVRKSWSERQKKERGTDEYRSMHSARRKAYFVENPDAGKAMSANKRALFAANPDLMAKKYKPVDQFSNDGIFIARHKSMKHAAEALGVSLGAISQAINKGCKSSGFRWKLSPANL